MTREPTRDHHVAGQGPGWRAPRASLNAWRTSPLVAREIDRAERRGFLWGCAATVVGALILWFAMGVHP